MESDPNWGILYFAYDWFSAIRTDLVKEVNIPLGNFFAAPVPSSNIHRNKSPEVSFCAQAIITCCPC